MKKLGIFLIIVLTLILAIPSISFADRFIDSFNTYIPHSDYYGYYESPSPYYYEYPSHYYYNDYEYRYYESPAPYYGYHEYPYSYYESGPFYYGPSIGLGFGFRFR